MAGCIAQAQPPPRYAVLVHEVFADPEPSMGLPSSSFIELRNVSGQAVNLKGWTLQVNTTTVRINTDRSLQPDSLLILCSSAAAPSYRLYGDVLPVTGFPSLPDAGGTIALYGPDHRTIHAIEYSRDEHENDLKKEGGWSLEMIDASKPCMEAGNWTSSRDPSGGTPGRINSVAGPAEEDGPPHALRSWTSDSIHIIVLFDRTLDSLSASHANRYALSGGPDVDRAEPIPPLYRMVRLTLKAALMPKQIHQLVVQGMTDCEGSPVGADTSLRAGLPADAGAGSVVLNELLFNPKPEGSDYVELLNIGDDVLDAASLSIAKRDAQGKVTDIKPCSPVPFLVFPGDHYVLSADPAAVRKTFLVVHPERQSPPASMPSMPDEEGDVLIMDRQGRLLDEVHYLASWHFPLLEEVEGVALERIDPHGPAQDPANWHSAAAVRGYGTPTDRNSQQRTRGDASGGWTADPEVISPDMDGHDDVLTLSYRFPAPGWTATVTIYDREGRPIRYLCRHMLCGNSGSLRWDGMDEKGKHPGYGAYILVAESFDLSGHQTVWRKRISVAGTGR